MWGLLLLGVSLALALATTAARPKKPPIQEPVEIIIEPPPPRDPITPPITPVDPIPDPPIPNIGESQVLRVFVLDTTDKPVSSLARTVIENNYREAVYWVGQEMGPDITVRYYPTVRYIHLPYTSTDIRNIVLGPHPRPPEYDENGEKIDNPSWPLFEFIINWMAENTEWDAEADSSLDEAWIFMVRGAGGFAGGVIPVPPGYSNSRAGIGIVGDAALSAWLGDAGLEVNDAYKYVFLGDRNGREEWEIGYTSPAMTERDRRKYTTSQAQIGSFIHEGFHAMFAPYHLGDLPQFQSKDKDGNIVSNPPSNIMDNWWDYPHQGDDDIPIHPIVRADALESFFV